MDLLGDDRAAAASTRPTRSASTRSAPPARLGTRRAARRMLVQAARSPEEGAGPGGDRRPPLATARGTPRSRCRSSPESARCDSENCWHCSAPRSARGMPRPRRSTRDAAQRESRRAALERAQRPCARVARQRRRRVSRSGCCDLSDPPPVLCSRSERWLTLTASRASRSSARDARRRTASA